MCSLFLIWRSLPVRVLEFQILFSVRVDLLVYLMNGIKLSFGAIRGKVVAFHFALEAWRDVLECGEGDVIAEREPVICVGNFCAFLLQVDVYFVIFALAVAVDVTENGQLTICVSSKMAVRERDMLSPV